MSRNNDWLWVLGFAALVGGGYYVYNKRKKAAPKALPAVPNPLTDLDSPDLSADLADILFG